MTTADSDLALLKEQADRMAATLKRAARGEKVVSDDPGGKMAAALASDGITFGIAMDDKVIKMRMLWATIRDTTEEALSEFIVNTMRKKV
jgi:hypothetical protein